MTSRANIARRFAGAARRLPATRRPRRTGDASARRLADCSACWPTALALALLLASCASGGGPRLPTGGPPYSAAAFEPVTVERFVGEWRGVYFAYPEPMGLTLTLRQAGGDNVEGEVQFYRLTQRRNIMPPPEGEFTVRGSFDPVLRTFELTPGSRVDRSRQAARPFRLDGVMDPAAPALAGLLDSRSGSYFTLTRPDHVQALTGPMLAAGGQRSGFSFGRGPNDATLIRWASKLAEEYPDLDPRRTQMGQLYAVAVNLFEDEHFAEHFGKTFDRMSAGERNAVHRRIRRTTTFSGSRPGSIAARMERRPNEELREFSALARAFSPTGTQGAPDVMHAVLALRVIRSWRSLHLARIERLPATVSAIDELDRLESVAENRLRTLWPGERSEFAGMVDGSRRRLAGPVLRVRANEAVAAASGYDGARALAAWPEQNRRLLTLAPAADRQAALSRVSARLDEILAPLLEREAAALAGLGRGVPAVLAGNAWYRDYRRRYDFVANRPAVQAPLRRLTDTRPAHLAQARGDVVEVIHHIRRRDEVDELVAEVLAVPGDRATPAGRAILAAADDRKREIQLEERRGIVTVLGSLVGVACHFDMQDADERGDRTASFLLGWCRRVATEQVVKANFPQLTDAEVAGVADRILQVLDGRFRDAVTGRETVADHLVRDLRTRFPNRTWNAVALESLVEALAREWGGR